MQAPQRMQPRERRKVCCPRMRLRPLSTMTTCISPPASGPLKWEVYVVMGCPVPLRARRRRNTPRSWARGISFSTPMQAICRRGRLVPISALPSLVQTTTPPVSAMAKLTPVSPAWAPMNLLRRWPRAASVRYLGSDAPLSVPSSMWKRSPISSRFKWMAGMTMWLGGSLRSCTMRSPRSVSVTSMPRASR